MSDMVPLLKGTLDILVLKALSWTPMHGIEITNWLAERSGGELSFDESGVYQALYRMEARGLIEAEWGVSSNNRRARFYSITPDGRRHLKTETRQFVRYGKLLTGILTGPAESRGAG
jgi:transcriptional regulator